MKVFAVMCTVASILIISVAFNIWFEALKEQDDKKALLTILLVIIGSLIMSIPMGVFF